MTAAPQAALLPDGRRLHLHHGPIDLIIEVIGAPRDAAYARATARFQTILSELVDELPALRRPLDGTRLRGPVAQRMARAVAPFTDSFITPMAAVAGAVADEMLAALVASDPIPKAYVNNGGDIAFHISPGQSVTARSIAGDIEIAAQAPTRGMATSGRSGRSFSLGIADAVTVLARSAAEADAAATLIANAVDLSGHPAIARAPARDISPDSDLGDRLVTTGVGPLTHSEIAEALARGTERAETFLARGRIHGATLSLNGQVTVAAPEPEKALTHA